MADFLDEKHGEITRRLAELKPLVEEYARLEQAARALAGVGASSGASRVSRESNGRRRKPGRPRNAAVASGASPVAASKPRAGRKRRGGRPKGTGGRAAEALAAVQGQPGITIPELAAKMGIKQNYLYRVMPSLAKEKKVRKKDKGWHPLS
jgi:hypothetical protein